jgi:hypothetical protein
MTRFVTALALSYSIIASDRGLRLSRALWYMFVIPALGRLRQEDGKFQASLSYIVRHFLKINLPPQQKRV